MCGRQAAPKWPPTPSLPAPTPMNCAPLRGRPARTRTQQPPRDVTADASSALPGLVSLHALAAPLELPEGAPRGAPHVAGRLGPATSEKLSPGTRRARGTVPGPQPGGAWVQGSHGAMSQSSCRTAGRGERSRGRAGRTRPARPRGCVGSAPRPQAPQARGSSPPTAAVAPRGRDLPSSAVAVWGAPSSRVSSRSAAAAQERPGLHRVAAAPRRQQPLSKAVCRSDDRALRVRPSREARSDRPWETEGNASVLLRGGRARRDAAHREAAGAGACTARAQAGGWGLGSKAGI